MLYALFYAIIRRDLRMNVISSDTEAEVLVVRHELAELRRQIKRPKLRVEADDLPANVRRSLRATA